MSLFVAHWGGDQWWINPHWGCFICPGMNARTLVKAFFICPCFSHLFSKIRIIRLYVVASAFSMLFYRGADLPIRSRLVFSLPGLPTSFTLSNTRKGTLLQLTLYTTPDFSGLKAVLEFSPFKIRLIPSDTPLKYGTDAYVFEFSPGFGCALFGWLIDLTEFPI